MKKLITKLMMFALVIGVMPLLLPVQADAQQKIYAKRVVTRSGRVRYVRTKKPSFYRRHRNRINMAAGTAGGAILGGLIGGKKGALIGAGAGLGGSALYTYKIRPKKKKYVRIKRGVRRY